MNAVERIKKAIERLETLKDVSTPGPWAATRHGVETVPEYDMHRFDIMAETIARTELLHTDTELIVTLHRTIDAQLAILRAAHFRIDARAILKSTPWVAVVPPELVDAVALADAILGGES